MRTRQVRAVSEIEICMSQHWSTMVTVYIIGAAVTFVLTFVIFWMLERQSEKEEREKELFPEYYEEQETKQDRIMVKLTFFILSVLVAVIWIGVPFILAFIFIMSVIDDSGDKNKRRKRNDFKLRTRRERKIFRRKSRRSDGNRVAGYKLV